MLPAELDARLIDLSLESPRAILGFEFDPVAPSSIQLARTWIAQFPALCERKPDVYPTGWGCVQCEWRNGDQELSFEFYPDERIGWSAYNFESGVETTGELVTTDAETAKADMQALVDWLLEVQ